MIIYLLPPLIMQQACSNGSCGTPQQMAGNCQPSSQAGCDSSDCCPKSHMEKMACMVKCAKMCLMKDKMKAHLEAKMGKKLDEAAALAVDVFLDGWDHKVGHAKKKHEAEEKLMKLMMG